MTIYGWAVPQLQRHINLGPRSWRLSTNLHSLEQPQPARALILNHNDVAFFCN